ncbi:transposase [Rhodococcus qingshengii]
MRHTPEQIIRKLHHGEELAATGADVEKIARQLDVSVPTLYNWREQYGGMKADDAKEFQETTGLSQRYTCKVVGQPR